MYDDSMGTGCGIVALLVIIAIFVIWNAFLPVDISDGAVVRITEAETVDSHGATSGGNVVVVVLSELGAAITQIGTVLCGAGLIGWIGMVLLVVGLLGLAGSK